MKKQDSLSLLQLLLVPALLVLLGLILLVNPDAASAMISRIIGYALILAAIGTGLTAVFHAEASGWQFKSGYNEGVLYVVEAKTKMTVQLVATDEINAWFNSSSHVVIVVRRADGTLEVIRDTMDTGKDVFSCEPVTLEAGDTFIFEFRFEWTDYRNLQNPPYMIFSNIFAE